MVNSKNYQYIDFTEFLLGQMLSKNLSSDAIFNFRVVTNLIVKLIIYFIWHHQTSFENVEQEIIFLPILWFNVDLQIVFERDYLRGEYGNLYYRQRNYKFFDFLYDFIVLGILSQTVEYDILVGNYIYFSLAIIAEADGVLNLLQLIKHCCFKKSIMDEQEAQQKNKKENNNYGGYRLFYFSIILGSVFAFYQYYQFFQQYDAPIMICTTILGQIIVDLIAAYSIITTEDEFSSSLNSKNMLLVVYGLLVGMMNSTISFLMGMLIGVFIICYSIPNYESKRRKPY